MRTALLSFYDEYNTANTTGNETTFNFPSQRESPSIGESFASNADGSDDGSMSGGVVDDLIELRDEDIEEQKEEPNDVQNERDMMNDAIVKEEDIE